MSILSKSEWDQFTARHPEAHLLQLSGWGELKKHFSWEPVWIGNKSTGTQILFRRLPFGFSIGYIPMGPVGFDWNSLWAEIDQVCQDHKAIFLKVEPDGWEERTNEFREQIQGFIPGSSIQPRRTILVDLHQTEEQILGRMKQKTRYNINLAMKKDITIRAVDDIHDFYNLMTTTGSRDGFGVHAKEYYALAMQIFGGTGKCRLLMAYFENNPVAGIMVFATGKRAWYFYGASSDRERNRMPTYLLQWEAIRWAKSIGCDSYDLWGIPDENEEALESQFEQRTDGLWKVYRFKRGFGGQIMRTAGAWDKVYKPTFYKLYRLISNKASGAG